MPYKYPEEHRVITLLRSREWAHLQKVRVLAAYSNPKGSTICNNCGEQDVDVLCIDRILGGGNKHRRDIRLGSGFLFYSWLEKNNFPKGYQVLCYNCNTRKTRVERYRNRRLA